MDKNLHDIDKLFYDAVEPHEEAPSSKVWEGIDKQLDNKGFTTYKKKYDRLKWLLLLLLLISTGLFTYIIQGRGHHKNGSVNGNTVSAAKDNKNQTAATGTEQKIIPAPKTNNTIKPTETITADQSNNNPKKKANTFDNNIKPSSPIVSTDATTFSEKNPDLKPGNLKSNNKKQEKVVVATPGQTKRKTELLVKKTNAVPDKAATTPDHDYVTSSVINGKTGRSKKEIQEKKIADDEQVKHDNIILQQDKVIEAIENQFSILSVKEPAYPLVRLSAISIPAHDSLLQGVDLSTNQLVAMAQQKRAAGLKRIQRGSSFSIIPYYMPVYSTLHIEEGERVHREDDDRDAIKNRESDAEGQAIRSFGLLAEWSINKRLAVQTGIGFYSSSVNIQPQTIYAHHKPGRDSGQGAGANAYKFNCTAGSVYFNTKTINTNPLSGDSLEALNSSVKLSYTQIPVTLRYNVITRNKLNLFAITGIYANLLTKSNVNLTLSNGSAKENLSAGTIDGLRKVNYSWVLGAGMEYRLGSRFSLYGNVNTNTGLTPINKDTPVKTNISNIGVQAGVKIRL
jgi:Outer membrane protein beta-barrel domain